MLKYTLFALTLLGIASCNQGKKSEKLYDQVMALHDTIMKDWVVMPALKAKLNAVQDSNLLAKYGTSIQDSKLELKKAYDLMSDWMESFTPPSDDEKEGTKISFYEEHLLHLQKMDQASKLARKNGEMLIEKLSNEN